MKGKLLFGDPLAPRVEVYNVKGLYNMCFCSLGENWIRFPFRQSALPCVAAILSAGEKMYICMGNGAAHLNFREIMAVCIFARPIGEPTFSHIFHS